MRKNFYLLLKALGNALQCKMTKNRIWVTNKCYTCSQGTLVFHFNLTVKKTFFPLMLLKKFWRTKSFTLKGAGIIQKWKMLYLCFAPIPALISESIWTLVLQQCMLCMPRILCCEQTSIGGWVPMHSWVSIIINAGITTSLDVELSWVDVEL